MRCHIFDGLESARRAVVRTAWHRPAILEPGSKYPILIQASQSLHASCFFRPFKPKDKHASFLWEVSFSGKFNRELGVSDHCFNVPLKMHMCCQYLKYKILDRKSRVSASLKKNGKIWPHQVHSSAAPPLVDWAVADPVSRACFLCFTPVPNAPVQCFPGYLTWPPLLGRPPWCPLF